MAYVTKRGNGYRVRYRDPQRRLRSRTFRRKVDATRFAAEVETQKNRGEWVDPRRAATPFGEWATRWAASRLHLKASTRATSESLMRNHVLPYFSALPLGSVTPTDVQGFVAHLEGKGLAPSTVRQCWLLAQGVFSSAVDSDLIPKTPCRGINLPRPRHNEVRALTPEQVAIVADAISARHRVLILTAANTGMRFGELAGLRVGRLDLLKRTVTVAEQLTEVRGGVEYSEPKHGSRRTVTLPRFLCDELALHLATYPSVGKDVFTMPEGGPLRRSNFRRRVWLPTVNATGLEDFTFHSLRHAHAAALIALGEHPKVISSRLGHSSISVTMDTYGHLFDGLDARTADRLDEAHTRPSAPISRPSASSKVAQLFS